MKNSYPILIFDPDDNVATAIRALAAGTAVAECLQTCEQIPFAFKVALRDIPAGTYIRKYGIYIGRALQPAMDLSRDKNAEEMKWSPLEMGAAMQAHGA